MSVKKRSFWKDNLAYLQKKQPQLLAQIEGSRASQKYRVEDGKREKPTLCKVGAKGPIYFHSRYDPVSEAEKLVAEYSVSEADFLIIFGFGLGYHIDAALKRLKEGVPVVVIEKDPEVFSLALEACDLRSILQYRELYLSVGEELQNELWSALGSGVSPKRQHLKRWVVLPHPVAFRQDRAFYEYAVSAIRDALIVQATAEGTKVTMGLRWPLNTGLNLPHILESVPAAALAGAYSGAPLFLVAAGPSLEEEYEALKEAKERGVICAVGTAYRVLLREGIVPHYVLAVDAGPLNFKHFEGIENEESALIYDPMIYPEILEKGREKKVVCRVTELASNPLLKIVVELFGDIGYLSAGFSVATLGLALAPLFGADPLVLIGQDLSFPGGKSHAEGTALYKKLELSPDSALAVPANDGKMVKTSYAWIATLEYYREALREFPGKVYNTSWHGAAIEGAEYISLRELLKQLPKREVRFPEKLPKLAEDRGKREELAQRIEAVKEDLLHVKEEAGKGRKDAEALYLAKLKGKALSQALRTAIQKRLDTLKKSEERFYLEPYFHEAKLYLQKSEGNRPEGTDPLLWELNRAGIFFESFEKAAQMTEEIFTMALKKIASEEEEKK